MFTRFCGNKEPHISHDYTKHWRKIDLDLLPEPERYPDEWDSRYSCPGARKPGMTLAESLGYEIPDNAPGGQRMALPVAHLAGSRQNANEIEYEGFFDHDGFHRGDD